MPQGNFVAAALPKQCLAFFDFSTSARVLLVSVDAWNEQRVVVCFVAQLQSCYSPQELDDAAIMVGITHMIKDLLQARWILIQSLNV